MERTDAWTGQETEVRNAIRDRAPNAVVSFFFFFSPVSFVFLFVQQGANNFLINCLT